MFSYPTPFTPPTTEDDRLSWLRLIRSRRVGVATFHRLIGEHGSARAALAALPEIARASGIDGYAPCPEGVAISELRAARAAGARMLCWGDADYPARLAEITDAPPVLWAAGDFHCLARPMVALVGARNASSLGTRMARKLAEGLSEAGICVVSGLARGIDTIAHEASVARGTVAVMAGGVDVIYPAENAGLAGRITETGVRLSEQPMGLQPVARHFPLRNRIISGLSQAVVVVEAAAQSGSLITARLALDQGREVLAVPGHPFDGRASGCNILIRDGARLVRGPEDVIEILGTEPVKPNAGQPRLLSTPVPTARALPARPVGYVGPAGSARSDNTGAEAEGLRDRILARIGPSPVAEDQVLRDLGIGPAEAATEFLDLELAGRITRLPGGLIALTV